MQLTNDEYNKIEDLPNEIWKDIEGYEGYYQVSNLGRVKALEHTVRGKNQFTEFNRTYPEHIVKHTILKHNYCQVSLFKNGKRKMFLIHRLVAQTFIPNPNNYPEINHKDANPSNNSIDNLEWCDKIYNIQYAIKMGWNPHKCRLGATNGEYQRQRTSQAKSIKCRCLETGEIFKSMTEAEKYFGLYSGAVNKSITYNKKIYGLYSFGKVV